MSEHSVKVLQYLSLVPDTAYCAAKLSKAERKDENFSIPLTSFCSLTELYGLFWCSEARKSLNRPPARLVLDNLIYNYSPTYCGKAG